MIILGLHGGVTSHQHDAGAALVIDGKLVVACEEERFTRVKSAPGHLPLYSIRACLKEAGITIKDVDHILHPGETYEDMPERIKLYMKHYFGYVPQITMVNHHLAHMASAFYSSDFDQAMIVSYDGFGDQISCAIGIGDKDGIKILETEGPQRSLGLCYCVITSFLGFKLNEDEYKVMGLAPYGRDGIDLSQFIKVSSDSYQIDASFFERTPAHYSNTEPFYNDKLIEILGAARSFDTPISQHYKDVAFQIQKILEQCACILVKNLHKKTALNNLCLAGGVALNCSANLAIRKLKCLDKFFIQPASSDRGLPLGCALYGASIFDRVERGLKDVYLGPSYSDKDLLKALDITGTVYEKLTDPAKTAAEYLAQGKIIAWWQGRSEFGPRALGNRSILADPRSASMKEEINARVKFREEFRPFAPAVLEERAAEIFDMNYASPFMTQAVNVRPEWCSRIQAVTHVNGTARVQTVNSSQNALFYNLISEFEKLTSVPVVLNTSFNIRGQPIVETPIEALSTIQSMGVDALFLGPYLIRKHRQPWRPT